MPDPINPEVVQDIPAGAKPVNASQQNGQLAWNSATTFKSPFFWLVLGAVAIIVWQEVMHHRSSGKPLKFL